MPKYINKVLENSKQSLGLFYKEEGQVLNMNFKYIPYSDELANMILNHKSDSPSPPVIVATERYTIKDYEPIGVEFDVILRF